jgi:uncharacterized protein with HEPN domain
MKDDKLYLIHISECIAKIVQYTHGGRDAFFSSPLIQDAVVRNFEIIGEASKHISPALKQRYPDVAWRQLAGFRDVLIHNYMGVKLAQVWGTIEQSLPQLQQQIAAILADQPPPHAD